MTLVIYISISIITFFFMEGVAWFTHKYIMHGFMWSWHRSHHKIHPHALEMNDLFAIVFSIPSVICFYIGYQSVQYHWFLYIGIGILIYGIFYFIFHDVIVHRRIKVPFKFQNKYLKRIIRAHYVHHEKHTKEDCESFGFLYASKKHEE